MASFTSLARSRASFRTMLRASRSSFSELEASHSISRPAPSLRSRRRSSSSVPRLPLGFSCLESMLPLHSAIASARLRSVLAAESQSWGWVPQGISMPL